MTRLALRATLGLSAALTIVSCSPADSPPNELRQYLPSAEQLGSGVRLANSIVSTSRPPVDPKYSKYSVDPEKCSAQITALTNLLSDPTKAATAQGTSSQYQQLLGITVTREPNSFEVLKAATDVCGTNKTTYADGSWLRREAAPIIRTSARIPGCISHTEYAEVRTYPSLDRVEIPGRGTSGYQAVFQAGAAVYSVNVYVPRTTRTENTEFFDRMVEQVMNHACSFN